LLAFFPPAFPVSLSTATLAGRAWLSTACPHQETVLAVPLRLTATLFRPALVVAFEENNQ
jgi:hypothetical protein